MKQYDVKKLLDTFIAEMATSLLQSIFSRQGSYYFHINMNTKTKEQFRKLLIYLDCKIIEYMLVTYIIDYFFSDITGCLLENLIEQII